MARQIWCFSLTSHVYYRFIFKKIEETFIVFIVFKSTLKMSTITLTYKKLRYRRGIDPSAMTELLLLQLTPARQADLILLDQCACNGHSL